MSFAAWYAILVGLLILGQWGFFLATGSVPELQTAPLEIATHLTAEGAMALALIASGLGLLRRLPWARRIYPVAGGMLLYSVVNSSGYFLQSGQWPLVIMFAVLLVLTLFSLGALFRAPATRPSPLPSPAQS